MWNVDVGGGWEVQQNMQEIGVLSAQLCCEPNTALKIKVNYNDSNNKRLLSRKDNTEEF